MNVDSLSNAFTNLRNNELSIVDTFSLIFILDFGIDELILWSLLILS